MMIDGVPHLQEVVNNTKAAEDFMAAAAAAAADLADALRSQHLQTLDSQTPKDLS